MNKKLQTYARKCIARDILKCTIEQQKLFMRIHGNGNYVMDEVIKNIPADKLDIAMIQIENTIKLNKK